MLTIILTIPRDYPHLETFLILMFLLVSADVFFVFFVGGQSGKNESLERENLRIKLQWVTVTAVPCVLRLLRRF